GREDLLVAGRLVSARTMTRRTAFAIGTALRRMRTQFIHRQFAIAVFVERAQRRRRVRDFVFVEHAVVVGVERGHHRRHGPATAGSARTARTAGAFAARRTLAAVGRVTAVVLGVD